MNFKLFSSLCWQNFTQESGKVVRGAGEGTVRADPRQQRDKELGQQDNRVQAREQHMGVHEGENG